MSTYYRELVAGHEVVHDWDSMQQRPLVVISRPGTRNDAAYFTADEARRLARALIAAADEAER